jgi:hypothetical protein
MAALPVGAQQQAHLLRFEQATCPCQIVISPRAKPEQRFKDLVEVSPQNDSKAGDGSSLYVISTSKNRPTQTAKLRRLGELETTFYGWGR